MSHQPFENWILTDTALSTQEQLALRTHIDSCESCTRLSTAWRSVERHLHQPVSVEPAPGFSRRWKLRQEAELKRRHRRQSLFLLTICLVGAAILGVGMITLWLPAAGSLDRWLLAWMYEWLTLTQFWDILHDLFITGYLVLGNTHNMTPLLGLVLAAGLACNLVVLWIVSVRLLSRKNRRLIVYENNT
jgi:hypothetical protein